MNKNKKKIVMLACCIVLLVFMTSIITSNSQQESPQVDFTPELIAETEALYTQLNSQDYTEFYSYVYYITPKYISEILPGTLIEDFKGNFNVNNFKVYVGQDEVTEGIVKTGMKMVVNGDTYILIVKGDLNNDGLFNNVDVNRIIKNINNSTDVNEIYKEASDLNDDGVLDESDAKIAARALLEEEFTKSELGINYPTVTFSKYTGVLQEDGWYVDLVKYKVEATNLNTLKLFYEVKGTHNTELTEIANGGLITLDKYGAYKINIYAQTPEGNYYVVKPIIVGVDTSDYCAKYGIETLSECMLINDGNYKSVESAIAGIKTKTANFSQIPTADDGLLMAFDEDGESFYYMGALEDNFVEFAGYTWRIIRRNGDGSVRMIYNGTSTKATGVATSIGIYKYNSGKEDAAFVGYKYGLNQEFKVTNNTLTYTGIGETSSYYFADDITCSEETKKCSLSGNIISGVWSDKYSEVLNGNVDNGNVPYKYTCWGKSSSTTCGVASEIVNTVVKGEGIDPKRAKVKYHGYLSKTYADTYVDDIDSNIKTIIDTWYVNNLKDNKDAKGNNYSSYLVDQVFCNDRSLASGDGHTLEAFSYYGAYNRNTSSSNPSLICPRNEDKFTVSTENGNGKLTYPIALITIDEVMMARGESSSTNGDFWLKTGQYYWTMSPASISTFYSSIYVSRVSPSGKDAPYWPSVSSNVRPVINLSSEVLVTGGDGTVDNPYKVSLGE